MKRNIHTGNRQHSGPRLIQSKILPQINMAQIRSPIRLVKQLRCKPPQSIVHPLSCSQNQYAAAMYPVHNRRNLFFRKIAKLIVIYNQNVQKIQTNLLLRKIGFIQLKGSGSQSTVIDSCSVQIRQLSRIIRQKADIHFRHIPAYIQIHRLIHQRFSLFS